MVKWVGSKYGGWNIDIDKVTPGSVVVSAGLGNDITFDEELIKLKRVYVVGIDPTNLTKKTIEKKRPANFTLIRKTLSAGGDKVITMADTNGASIYDKRASMKVQSVTLDEICEKYKNVSVLKMNIEGAEYEVLQSIVNISIPQVLVRFHHRKENVPFTYQDTMACIGKLQNLGYKFSPMSDHKNKNVDYEVLFERLPDGHKENKRGDAAFVPDTHGLRGIAGYQ